MDGHRGVLYLDFQQFLHASLIQDVADEEVAELAKTGGHFVESHFVHDMLELQRIVGEPG